MSGEEKVSKVIGEMVSDGIKPDKSEPNSKNENPSNKSKNK